MLLCYFYRAAAVSTNLRTTLMKGYMTAGLTVLAGVALFEAALIPAVVIGGAAVLAPQYLPKLGRRLRRAFNSTSPRRAEPAPLVSGGLRIKSPVPALPPAPTAPRGDLKLKQAVAKTITFRIIVTTLDFTTNYLVIGELATAAGLSAFALVAGPLFYLFHEAAWNYFAPSGTAVKLPVLRLRRADAPLPLADGGGPTISRALAKTITFRIIATTMEFTATYVVVGDLATAAGLSAFGFVVGPFVYLGHEKVWDYYGSSQESSLALPPPMELAPAVC
jgi:uncharacterized membrane protein